MELFDTLSEKRITHDDKVKLAYSCYKSDMVEMVFPGNIKQADNIIISIAQISHISLEEENVKGYYELLSIFSEVFIRSVIIKDEDESIISNLRKNHEKFIKNDKMASLVCKYCKLSIKDNSFILNSVYDIQQLEQLVAKTDAIDKDNENKNKNIHIQDNIDDINYGLCPEHPIFTNDIEDTKSFLNSLRSCLGEEVSWEMQGLIDVKGIFGKVSIYVSLLPSGKSYKTIYICENGINAQKKVPKGFISSESKYSSNKLIKEEGYYFENLFELEIYGRLYGKGNTIYALSGNDYIDMYNKGYQLFECKQYTKAIEIYKECLELNPIGISARFELVECYIAIKQFEIAKKSLMDMKDFLYNDTQKAKYYRRLGYISTEQRNFELAYACYVFSLKYEKSESALHELTYIESKSENVIDKKEPKEIFAQYSIPIL